MKKVVVLFTTTVLAVLVNIPEIVSGAETLIITSDAPAILGAPLHFWAKLENPSPIISSYTIAWQENYPNTRNFKAALNSANSYTSNWTLIYTGSPGTYSITVVVDYEFVFIHFPVANQLISYNVTSNFTGYIKVTWPKSPAKDPFVVSTLNETVLAVNLHDPSHYINKAINVTYDWKIDNQTVSHNYTLNNGSSLRHNFTQEKKYIVEVNLTTLFNLTESTNSTTNTTNLVYRNSTFRTEINAKVPIVNFTITGSTWYRHGKLLDIQLECDGTPPYKYCWAILTGAYNVTGNETCPSSPSVTNECEIPITRYISLPGIYTLLVWMENDISAITNRTVINVYKNNPKGQLSIIVVPLSCSLLALVLIIFGVAYYWESRARFSVEVADFDFGPTETITYMSFMDRLRDSLSASLSNATTRHRRRSGALLIPPDNSSSVMTSAGDD